MLNYLQRLNLICDLTHLPAARFTSCKIPVETFTSPQNTSYHDTTEVVLLQVVPFE